MQSIEIKQNPVGPLDMEAFLFPLFLVLGKKL